MLKNIHKYPAQVWGSTILVTPFILLIVNLFLPDINNGESEGLIILQIIMIMVFGTFLSIPALFVFWIISELLIRTVQKTILKKVFISLTGTILTFITFLIIIPSEEKVSSTLIFATIYSAILSIFSLLYRIKT